MSVKVSVVNSGDTPIRDVRLVWFAAGSRRRSTIARTLGSCAVVEVGVGSIDARFHAVIEYDAGNDASADASSER